MPGALEDMQDMQYDFDELRTLAEALREALTDELELTECLSKWGDVCREDTENDEDELCSVCSKWELVYEFDRWLEEYDAREEDKCDQCGGATDDGEGWNGLCGDCADKAERLEDEDEDY